MIIILALLALAYLAYVARSAIGPGAETTEVYLIPDVPDKIIFKYVDLGSSFFAYLRSLKIDWPKNFRISRGVFKSDYYVTENILANIFGAYTGTKLPVYDETLSAAASGKALTLPHSLYTLKDLRNLCVILDELNKASMSITPEALYLWKANELLGDRQDTNTSPIAFDSDIPMTFVQLLNFWLSDRDGVYKKMVGVLQTVRAEYVVGDPTLLLRYEEAA